MAERNQRGVVTGQGPFQPPRPSELQALQTRIDGLEARIRDEFRANRNLRERVGRLESFIRLNDLWADYLEHPVSNP